MKVHSENNIYVKSNSASLVWSGLHGNPQYILLSLESNEIFVLPKHLVFMDYQNDQQQCVNQENKFCKELSKQKQNIKIVMSTKVIY